jgi:adenosylcobyric acid synthase
MGVSAGPAMAHPAIRLDGRDDGAMSADGQILASYLHGIFDAPEACRALLAWAGLADAEPIDFAAKREASIDRLADTLEKHLQIERMFGSAE